MMDAIVHQPVAASRKNQFLENRVDGSEQQSANRSSTGGAPSGMFVGGEFAHDVAQRPLSGGEYSNGTGTAGVVGSNPTRSTNQFSSAPIQFDFDFFDLEIIPGLYANGTAEIAVHADGVNDDPEYFIGRIFLHGEDNKPEEVEGDPSLATELERQIYLTIFEALDSGSLSERVKDRMLQEIEQ